MVYSKIKTDLNVEHRLKQDWVSGAAACAAGQQNHKRADEQHKCFRWLSSDRATHPLQSCEAFTLNTNREVILTTVALRKLKNSGRVN